MSGSTLHQLENGGHGSSQREGVVGIKQAKQDEEGEYGKQTALLYIKTSQVPKGVGSWEGKSQGTLGPRWEVVVFKSNIFTAAITTKKTFAFRSHNLTHCVGKSNHSVPYQQVRSTVKRLQQLPIPKSINLRSSSNGRLTSNSSLR